MQPTPRTRYAPIMQVLTELEARSFLATNGFGEKLTHLASATSRTEVTTDVGRRCAYANMLTNHLITDESAVACLDITDWAVWPSSQNMDLFYSYWRYLGEPRLLIDAHFHVFPGRRSHRRRNTVTPYNWIRASPHRSSRCRCSVELGH